MNTRLWLLLPMIVGGWSDWVDETRAATKDPTGPLDVPQLISQLGDEQYLQRQRAETQLLERGVEAFAQLQAAGNHVDLEIATRAKYILNQIDIEWVRQTDPPAVRSIMARFGELSMESQVTKIGELAALADQQGFGPLARIARFESSGTVARRAALAILKHGFLPAARTDAAVTTLTAEFGENADTPQTWIRVYVDQLQSPQRIDPRWLQFLDEEIALLTVESNETSESLVLVFLRRYLDFCDELSDADAIMAGLQRRIELGDGSGESMSARLMDALTWLIDREQWMALELMEESYADALREDRLLLYYLAIAREKQGRLEVAETLAEQAHQLEGLDAERRHDVAEAIAALGHYDWAEREWRSIIDMVDAADVQSLITRQSLALFRLHDRLEHKAAADLLSEAIDAIEADPELKAQYQSDQLNWLRLNILRSHREYMLACHDETERNFESQRQHLEQAYKLDSSNADVLIAMYHVKDASPEYRKKTRQRIAKSLRDVETARKKAVTNPRWYNHWAWLVSNTEGDARRAVKYSKHSLELVPGSPSYLDTLGRCYYAAGDLDSAIDVQRQAVAKQPHLLVMQRQLAMFEDELQKRSKLDVPEQR